MNNNRVQKKFKTKFETKFKIKLKTRFETKLIIRRYNLSRILNNSNRF